MVGSDSEIVQFTQEQLEALLGEKFTENDPKKKLELMTEQNKMFKRCIKWHQQVVENRVLEKERLQSAMESTEQMRKDYELRCMRAEPQQGSDGLDQQVKAFTAQLVKLDEFNRTVCATLRSWELKAREMHSDSRSELEARERYVRELEDVLSNKESQLNEGEKLRKKLQNTILELKGNIRVFCRVRPLLGDDVVGTEAPVVFFPPSTEALGSGIDVIQNGNNYHFNFDEVFTGECSQQDCFEDTSELVQSALDGFKVCIFAYGQTGSGKTYTMMGRPDSSEHKGLIPRSLEQIFKGSQSLQAQGWKYKLQASMLEIYNETIRDLLSTNRSSGFDMSRAEKSVPAKRYAVKHDANGNAYVSDLSIVDVGSMEEISSLLQQAAQSRSVGRTQMNEQSSRSHFVFTLRICRVNESTGQQVQGVLNLIDLAGSERLSKSLATGDRLKETQAINKSLSSLADVISALAKKEDHIPFRNSKLTYLLQPYLGGDSKTLMFINISPEASCVGESLSSLRFATRVNACELGIPRIQSTVQHFKSPTSSRPFSHARRR